MKVIGLCGEIGGGKDAFADYLVKQKKYHKVIMSDIIAKELKKKNIEITRENLQNLSTEYKKKFGRGIWASASVDYAKEQGWHRLVISGIRDSEEVKVLHMLLKKDFLLVYIKADKEIRFERLLERRGPKDPKTIKELEAQEAHEKELYDLYDKFDKTSDVVTTNNGTIVELFAKADILLKEKGFEAKD
jgi:dephospho-CoA kinase